ncbi:hypothetical protein RCIA175 [Methanocella arvoryzae MRE50]|uniref:Uncharacterized protein n=1 Tax=Methanocella arvoryzae (strain DSM 22066 / NBRC 105507 / MRE50) TaxID=351160 RepID=Q0W2A1_METAR|nr:hypothetical protein RCIA175 [Methanocella arvoryzae MRE50]
MQVAGICPICKKPSNRLSTCKMCHKVVCSHCMVHSVCKTCYERRHPKRAVVDDEEAEREERMERRRQQERQRW